MPRIWADERAVRQVTLNLLSNAIKFTPQGGEIVIKVGWTASGGQYLSIRDTGPGIPEEEIPIVLSSFGRGSMAQKNADEGSGLGLPIVRGLVELHGGEFKLMSKVREGTEVIVIFPPERVMNALPQIDPDAPTEHELANKAAARARRARRQGGGLTGARLAGALGPALAVIASQPKQSRRWRRICGSGDTQKQVSQFPVRHCERSEAIQGPQYDRLGCWRRACCGPWIASSQGLLAMTDGSPLTRSIR